MARQAQTIDQGRILDALYEGVFEPDSVEEALRLSMEAIGASGVNLHIISKPRLETLFFAGFGDGYTDESVSAYHNRWQYINAHRDAMRRLYEEAPSAVFLCHEHISEQEFARGAYFQEFFKAIGQRWLAGGVVWSDAEVEISIAFSRVLSSGRYGEKERAFLEFLIPNVRRATRLAVKLAPQPGVSCGLGSARTPSFIVDGDRRVLWMNAAGEAYLSGAAPLSVEEQRLRVGCEQADRTLKDYVKCAADRRIVEAAPHFLRIGDETAELEVLPVTLPSGALIAVGGLSLVMVRKIGLDQSVCDILKVRYQMTGAECRLAMVLANGLSLEEAAEEGGISLHTVRTHLRNIFAKTGVKRQSALAALVWKLA